MVREWGLDEASALEFTGGGHATIAVQGAEQLVEGLTRRHPARRHPIENTHRVPAADKLEPGTPHDAGKPPFRSPGLLLVKGAHPANWLTVRILWLTSVGAFMLGLLVTLRPAGKSLGFTRWKP